MNDQYREVTHHNVERLLKAIENERDLRMKLQKRVDALQVHISQMTADLAQAKIKASAAFALASNQGGSTSGT